MVLSVALCRNNTGVLYISPFTVFALEEEKGHPVATPVWGEGDFIESPSATQLRYNLPVEVWNMMQHC